MNHQFSAHQILQVSKSSKDTSRRSPVCSTLVLRLYTRSQALHSFPGFTLVPRLRLGTHCIRGSASSKLRNESASRHTSAGGACNSVGSEAEPRNQRWRSARSVVQNSFLGSLFFVLHTKISDVENSLSYVALQLALFVESLFDLSIRFSLHRRLSSFSHCLDPRWQT